MAVCVDDVGGCLADVLGVQKKHVILVRYGGLCGCLRVVKLIYGVIF